MKAALEKLVKKHEESFVVEYFEYNYFPTPWHYHPEYELVLVTESTGNRLIGDHICNFKPGNLALIGPNIPHIYKNDVSYYQQPSTKKATSIVIHFSEASLGNDFLNLPESRPLKALLARSFLGMEITGDTNKEITERLLKIGSLNGLNKWLSLLDMLMILSSSNETKAICKTPMIGNNEKESDRLGWVFDWILNNYGSKIKLKEVAGNCNMTENSFSRFFFQRTRKTFSGFVAEVRLNNATRLLKESELNITQICYECGFNNVSNFNRQFLANFQISPLKYRQRFLSTV